MSLTKREIPEYTYQFYGPQFTCAYCSDPADTIDHAVPVRYVSGNHQLIARYRFVKVSACVSCNVLAGDAVDSTFIERRRRIAYKLRRKFFKVLQTADWPPEELAQLGPMLRAVVSNGVDRETAIHYRLRHLDSPIPPHGVPNDLFIRKAPLVMDDETDTSTMV